MKQWLVFYTKSRQEKKVKELLERRGFEVFLPLQKVMRQWSDRKKIVEAPLFNSYLFVFESCDNIPSVLQTPGVAWNIRHNDKPAVLNTKELETIKRFLLSGLLLESRSLEKFQTGDNVQVIDGPLKNMIGVLIKTKEGDKLTVALESIGQSLLVRIDSKLLTKKNLI